MRLLLVCLLLLGSAGCHAPSSRGAAGGDGRTALRIATWNLEWLVAPENFLALRRSCVPEGASPAGRRR
mgnify:CR=1 FL=1